MKFFILLLLNFTTFSLYGQEMKSEFDGHAWKAPYHLPIPKDWTLERFLIPITFAPQIPYKGVEDIRFTPGWAKVNSEEYWTYAFLWYLDSTQKMDANTIAKNLRYYYSGLIKSNTDSTKVMTKEPQQVVTNFKKAGTKKGDRAAFTGTIKMMDYMQRKLIVLNCIVRIKTCPRSGKTIVFHELSPKPFTHRNWLALDKLWTNFNCEAKEQVVH